MTTHFPMWLTAIVAAGTLAWGGAADAADATHWATGTALQRKLSEEITFRVVNSPLRPVMARLAQGKQVAILIDRRVDPGQKLNLSIQGVPLQTALETIARRLDLGVTRLGNVVYLGPPPAAKRLRPIAAAMTADARRLPSGVAQYLAAKPLAWDDLATPRDLLAGLAADNGLKLDGLASVPHDLWATADLPPLTLVERLTLIASQYDLAFTITDAGRRLDLHALPSEGS